MDRAPDHGDVNPSPRILRRHKGENGGPPTPATRSSIRAIDEKNIVQRRTQLFEQGKVEGDDNVNSDAKDKQASVIQDNEIQQKDKPPWQGAEMSKQPASPGIQKPAIMSPKPRSDIKSSPTHEPRSPRTSSEGVSVTPRARPQPRVIGVEAPSIESPSKPPRTKKPASKAKPHEGSTGYPSLPSKPARPTKPARPESVAGKTGKNPGETLIFKPPKPTRPAPDVPPSGPKEKPKRPAEKPEFIMTRNSLYSSFSEPGVSVDSKSERKVLSGALSADGTLPTYAVIDKSKKKRPKSNEEPAKGGSSQYYDGVIILPTAGDVVGADKPDAPPKPPRTFAHDVYLKKKAEKRDQRRPRSTSTPLYDEVATNSDSQKTEIVEPYAQDPPLRIKPYAQSSNSNSKCSYVEPYAQSTDDQHDGQPYSGSPGSKSVCQSPSVDGSQTQQPKLKEDLYSEIPEGDKGRKPAPPPRPRLPQRPQAPQSVKTSTQRNQSPVVKVIRHNVKVPQEGFIKSGRRKMNNPR